MNKRTQGNLYRAQTLRLLARVGYASTRQVAKAVWRECDISSRKMAGRTLRWLLERGYIVAKRNGDSVNGEQISAVTAAGAAWLAEHDDPLPGGKAHARDWLRHAHSHRTACNSTYAAMSGPISDPCVWSELEVRSKLSPLHEFAYRGEEGDTVKIPDLVAENADGSYQWVEVENNWRSAKDLNKMVECMRAMFRNPKRIACVHFVITAPGAKTIHERIQKALTHGLDSGWPRQIKELDARILAQHIRVSKLDPETLELTRIR